MHVGTDMPRYPACCLCSVWTGLQCDGDVPPRRRVLHVDRSRSGAGDVLAQVDAGKAGRRTRGGLPCFRLGLLRRQGLPVYTMRRGTSLPRDAVLAPHTCCRRVSVYDLPTNCGAYLQFKNFIICYSLNTLLRKHRSAIADKIFN